METIGQSIEWLRAANHSSAVAVWNAALPKSADASARGLLLGVLCASAADDLSSAARWRGLWLVRQIQSILTQEAMADAAVSLGMLRLGTQLALLGADDAEIDSVRESFYARLAGFTPRSWLITLIGNLQAVAANADATEKQRQAILDQMRRLIEWMPDAVELRQTLAKTLETLQQTKSGSQ